MLVPGTRIDRYEVEAEVGRGAMATVYRVRHTGLNTPFALKVMAVDHPGARERFRREAHVQATLRHPNLVAVHDYLDVSGAPGFVMELVDGESLAACLGARRLTLAQAEGLFRGILDGVEVAHNASVVHRDLKPGNVLLSHTRVGVVAKVADFGIAKVMSEGGEAWSLTASGTTMGTPGFLAPEQIRAAKHVDHRADLFSLGCVFYRMVTGRMAFVGDIREVFNAITTGVYPPPSAIVPDLPPRIAQAIGACLVADRDARVQTCAALREIARRAAVHRPDVDLGGFGCGRRGGLSAPTLRTNDRGVLEHVHAAALRDPSGRAFGPGTGADPGCCATPCSKRPGGGQVRCVDASAPLDAPTWNRRRADSEWHRVLGDHAIVDDDAFTRRSGRTLCG